MPWLRRCAAGSSLLPEAAFLASTDTRWPELLERAIRGEGVRAAYQPIVDLQRCTVAGYEALTRFEIGPPAGPDQWFAAAERHGVRAALEVTTLRAALSMRSDLPVNTFLTINVEPESLMAPEVIDVLTAEGGLAGLVIEVTEHRPIEDLAKMQWILDRLRAEGAMVAVDDAGAGYAGLQQILTLKPDILKADRALIEGIDHDESKAALVEMFGIFANRIDAWLLAEGVETIGEARRCAALGVALAQGYLFARPAPPWAGIAAGIEEQLLGAGRSCAATLHSMIELLPSVDAAHPGDARHLLVDVYHRPVGMFTAESLISGVTIHALRTNVNATVHEIAHRLSTSTHGDTVAPVLVTDNEGHYLGAIRIQRLFASLASAADHAVPASASAASIA
jgi:EAL domain-containing protein (putative c-di-GMP-specific phosphodiesterase class I)